MLINVLALRVWGSKVSSGAMSGFGGGSVFHTWSWSHGLTDEHRAVRSVCWSFMCKLSWHWSTTTVQSGTFWGWMALVSAQSPVELHKWLWWVKKTFHLYVDRQNPHQHSTFCLTRIYFHLHIEVFWMYPVRRRYVHCLRLWVTYSSFTSHSLDAGRWMFHHFLG